MDHLQSDKAFFKEIYNQTYKGLKIFVCHRSKNIAMVDDILQEVYLEMFRHISDLRNHQNVTGWLYKTADNKTKKLNKVYTRHSIREVSIDYLNSAMEDNSMVPFMQLEEYRSVLKEDEYKFLKLRYLEGYSHKELAELTGISEAGSKMRLSRIISKLRKMIKIKIFFLIFLNLLLPFV